VAHRCATYYQVRTALSTRCSFQYGRCTFARLNWRFLCETTSRAQIAYSYSESFPVFAAIFRRGVCVDNSYASLASTTSGPKLLVFNQTRFSNTTSRHQRMAELYYNRQFAENIKYTNTASIVALVDAIYDIERRALSAAQEDAAIDDIIETFCMRHRLRVSDQNVARIDEYYSDRTKKDAARQNVQALRFFLPLDHNSTPLRSTLV
jgi:hypothetical protein